MAPTLPLITARGAAGAHAVSHMTLKGNATDRTDQKAQDKFSKLKSVLVSNVLKYYHKKMHKQADEAIYARALQEVNKILANGKLTEKKLQELQRNFASGLIEDSAARPNAADSVSFAPQDADRGPGGDSTESNARIGGFQGLLTTDRASEMRTNTSKSRPKLDEWSVITLYNDVKHLEDQNEMKRKLFEEKRRTREELQVQIDRRKREKEAAKAAEIALALQQKEVYEKWQAEKAHADEQRHAKVLHERDAELQVLQQAQMLKKMEADQERREEQERIRELERQLEEEKKAREQMQARKNAAYQQTLIENKRVLEMKQHIKEQERQEEARLFALQLEMAEKQERLRAEQEQQRLAKLKAAERAAGVLENRAAQIEAQVEERVRRAQEERMQKEAARERSEREARERTQGEITSALERQVRERADARAQRAAEDRAVGERLRSDAEEFRAAQAAEREARRRAQLEHRARLDAQRQQRQAMREQDGGMSEIELQINATVLQKVAHK